MRLFIGINFADKQKGYLKKMQNNLSLHLVTGRPVKEENFHSTLLFLGEVPNDKLQELCAELQTVALRNAKFMTSFTDTMHFNNGCAVVKLKPAKNFLALHTDLTQTLAQYVKKHLTGKYLPHATLFRDAKFDMAFREVKKNVTVLNMPFDVDDFTLFESRQSATGIEYVPLTFFKLK